jgi:hypothetical protein
VKRPIVVIEVKLDDPPGSETVVFTAQTTGATERFQLLRGTLDSARTEVSENLRQFKEDVGPRLAPGADRVKRAFRELFSRTSVLAKRLMPHGSADLFRVRQLFEGAFPQWRDYKGVPLVQVEGPASGFPFELLALFGGPSPKSVDDIALYARRFLAFSTAVWRVPYVVGAPGGVSSGQELQAQGPLPVSLIWYQPFAGAQREHKYFADRPDLVELNGPWPELGMRAADTVVEELGGVLYDPHRRFAHIDAGSELQIQHFACHGRTEDAHPAGYELTLAGGANEPWPIPLAALDDDFDKRTDGIPRVRPLVFLNACGSGHIDPVRMYSWPHWFLQNGHRGVIGTETLVPDVVAARFSEFFYDELLAQRPLGAALVLARRKLLHEFMNPLGLLYVLYADPDLTVRFGTERPVDRTLARHRSRRTEGLRGPAAGADP